MAEKKLKIKDLIPDDQNFNTGTEFGNSLIEKSLSKFGAGRSILLDKNNRIIAGNKTIENAAANGFEDVEIVESDGKKIIAVKRTDLDLDDKHTREFALADNATAKANIAWDQKTITKWEMPAPQWGIHFDLQPPPDEGEPSPPPVTLADRFLIPPFSVLDARQGYWQDRKRAWLALGIQSELGRGENLQGLSDSNDEYRYNKEAFFAKKNENGLLGNSQQARSHYKQGGGRQSEPSRQTKGKSSNVKDRISPGGSPRPAMKLVNGKTVRGDGRGNEIKG